MPGHATGHVPVQVAAGAASRLWLGIAPLAAVAVGRRADCGCALRLSRRWLGCHHDRPATAPGSPSRRWFPHRARAGPSPGRAGCIVADSPTWVPTNLRRMPSPPGCRRCWTCRGSVADHRIGGNGRGEPGQILGGRVDERRTGRRRRKSFGASESVEVIVSVRKRRPSGVRQQADADSPEGLRVSGSTLRFHSEYPVCGAVIGCTALARADRLRQRFSDRCRGRPGCPRRRRRSPRPRRAAGTPPTSSARRTAAG